ncbi:MAG: hydrogenase maturation nickel metallochaperone HypA [Sedimentisphaerales bacterium]|nr:hydrogenase maturation nickel metallochaperone HypA [Sedimentisphaerales bacterium]
MHEAGIAQSLLAIISEEAARQNARPISAKISCGTLSGVNDEALRFAAEAIAKDTPCEGIKLEIEHKPLQAQCRDCNITFDVELSQPRCSACGGENFKLLPDAGLILEEVEFQTD